MCPISNYNSSRINIMNFNAKCKLDCFAQIVIKLVRNSKGVGIDLANNPVEGMVFRIQTSCIFLSLLNSYVATYTVCF